MKDLESRPAEQLLRDVAELVKPSESKAHAEERRKILESLDGTVKALEAGEQRDRVNLVIDRLRTQES